MHCGHGDNPRQGDSDYRHILGPIGPYHSPMDAEMIIAVTGGRKWQDAGFVSRNLTTILNRQGIVCIFHGGAKGWDTLCAEWARREGIPAFPIHAKWEDLSHPDARIKTRPDGTKYDAKAGSRRNGWILDRKPVLLVAGPGGFGTADMVRQAEERSIPIWHCRP